MEKKKKILKAFYLRPGQCKRLEIQAYKTGRSQAEIVREALSKYFFDKSL